MANRTPSGAPTADAREKYGMPDGSFPVWDHQSAMDALQSRGRTNPANRTAVVRHVLRWARKAGDQAVIDLCNQALKGN